MIPYNSRVFITFLIVRILGISKIRSYIDQNGEIEKDLNFPLTINQNSSAQQTQNHRIFDVCHPDTH